jgi:two-component SAPR family response regulator
MNPASKSAEPALAGLRVLIVEDMFLIAIDLADQLAGLGCEIVGPDSHVEGALTNIKAHELDGALLDVNLDGETSFPIASALSSRKIPFIFLTGYDGDTIFPAEFRSSPKLPKPVATETLSTMMKQHFVDRLVDASPGS